MHKVSEVKTGKFTFRLWRYPPRSFESLTKMEDFLNGFFQGNRVDSYEDWMC